MDSNPISQLNELGPSAQVNYTFEIIDSGFRCRVTLQKGKQTLTCFGEGSKKKDAKFRAAHAALGILQLLYPMIPFAMFNHIAPISSKYDLKSFDSNNINMEDGEWFHLPEIITGCINIKVDFNSGVYTILHSGQTMGPPLKCPIELINDPILYTDWSQGPVCPAQNNYIIKRVDALYGNMRRVRTTQ